MWKTTNALGLEVTWYSEEEVKELLKKIDILEENTKFVKSNKYGFFYEKDIDNLIKSKLETINQSCKNYKEILKLQAENKILKQYKSSKQASYESMQREWNNAVNKNRELKQTLTEIKEICKKESGWVNCSDNMPTETAIFAKQILQKISEYEGNNE